MQVDLSKVRLYLRPGPTDMRKAINGLAALAQVSMKLNPLDGQLYLFCNRRRDIIKVLYWDRNGFCLWQKRLEKHRFPWPRNAEAVQEIKQSEFDLLLRGVDFFSAHATLTFSSAV